MTAARADGRPRRSLGNRLRDPHDPAVRAALRRTCPDRKAEPEQWCVGIGENTRTRGRRLTRVHFARATFKEVPA